MTNPFKSYVIKDSYHLTGTRRLELRTQQPECFVAGCILKVLLKRRLSHKVITKFLLSSICTAYLLNRAMCFYNKMLSALSPLFTQNKSDSYPFISYSENIFSSLKLIDALL